MSELILVIIENINLILGIVLIVCFFLPIMIKFSKKHKSKDKKITLTKQNIIIESKLIYSISTMIFFMFFIFVGVMIVYLEMTFVTNKSSKIVAIIFGSLFILIPLCLSINALKKCKRILNGDYVIVVDTLKDKERIANNDSEFNSGRDWFNLFFENYFKKYNKNVMVNQSVFNRSKINDKFYLVFVKNDVYAFNTKDYELSDTDTVIPIENLNDYIDIDEFKLEKSNSTIRINKKRLINDFFDKKQKNTEITFILVFIFLLSFTICSLAVFKNVLAFIILLLILTFWTFLIIVKSVYLAKIIKNIKNDNYSIKVDKVVSLNNNIKYRDSNAFISFKFENYKKIVYADKKDYNDVSINDEFYLVFVNGEDEPIKVYQKKYSIIETLS